MLDCNSRSSFSSTRSNDSQPLGMNNDAETSERYPKDTYYDPNDDEVIFRAPYTVVEFGLLVREKLHALTYPVCRNNIST